MFLFLRTIEELCLKKFDLWTEKFMLSTVINFQKTLTTAKKNVQILSRNYFQFSLCLFLRSNTNFSHFGILSSEYLCSSLENPNFIPIRSKQT
jgi:hypothetical protein